MKQDTKNEESEQTEAKTPKKFEKMEKVASSKKEGWNKTGGVLVLDLLYKGTSDELAEVLDGKKIGNGKLEVIDVAPERLDCNLK